MALVASPLNTLFMFSLRYVSMHFNFRHICDYLSCIFPLKKLFRNDGNDSFFTLPLQKPQNLTGFKGANSGDHIKKQTPLASSVASITSEIRALLLILP